ncbi:hypothetical protein D3C86_1670770 [compost metagenome]
MSKPSNAAVCIMSIDLPSAKPSLMSSKISSSANSFLAILSAQVAPTAPAPTTVIFINFIFLCMLPSVEVIKLHQFKKCF